MRIALALLAISGTSLAQSTTRVSVDWNGLQVCGESGWYGPTSLSADGRFVAFLSDGRLLPGVFSWQTFVRDLQNGTTELVSTSSAGGWGDASSNDPSISADGRMVAFWSAASNLVPGDTNTFNDIFVRDRQSGTTTRASVGSTGAQANGSSLHKPSISADGHFVAFGARASNLVPGDTNGFDDVFVRDLLNGTNERVSVSSAAAQGNNDCVMGSISADGRFVAFDSLASNMVTGDTNSARDIFVRDRQTGTTERVSVSSAGAQGNQYSAYPAISDDGRFVAFYSFASNLVAGDVNGTSDIFLRDTLTGTTELVSVDSGGILGNGVSGADGLSISADGRFVAFASAASNLVPGDTNGSVDLFVRDRLLGTTTRRSTTSGGGQANFWSGLPSISDDGQCLAFVSQASNLVPGDTNAVRDVFVHQGGYADCNANGVADGQDILAGTSADCDGGGGPDECDLLQGAAVDCDSNGLLDSCELAANPSLDLNFDGRIDGCTLVCQSFWQNHVGGLAGADDEVRAMCVHDDGTGPALYVGGAFHHAGGVPAECVARWDGASWSALGSGVGGTPFHDVRALATYDDGSGPALYAGGVFTSAGGSPANGLARWNGQTWSAIGLGAINAVLVFAVCDLGTGPKLYMSTGGSLYSYDGNSLTLVNLGPGVTSFVIRAMVAFDDGSGPALFLGGQSSSQERALTVRWDGATATQSFGAFYYRVTSLAVHDEGGGAALYSGTEHTKNSFLGGVARWNGSGWSAVSGIDAAVQSLCSFDDGNGPALFACAKNIEAPCGSGEGVTRWSSGTGARIVIDANFPVWRACPFDDGTGPALYVGGWFTVVDHATANHIGRWGLPAGCVPGGSVICEPGVNGVIACPCSNPPTTAGRGCNNSSGTGGAQLTTTGFARLGADTLVFVTNGEKPQASSLLFQTGQAHATGLAFGQGVRCVTGSANRLYLKTAIGGSITAPGAGDLSVSARSAALGSPIAPGMHRYYGVYYRDPILLGGCPATSGFNVTQQLDVLWHP